jgi:hypothetical protein
VFYLSQLQPTSPENYYALRKTREDAKMNELDALIEKWKRGEILPHIEFCIVVTAVCGYKSAAAVAYNDLRMAEAQTKSVITVNDELHDKLNAIEKAVSQHRKTAFVTCDETCFCWTVVTMV